MPAKLLDDGRERAFAPIFETGGETEEGYPQITQMDADLNK